MSDSRTTKAEHYNVKVPDGYKFEFDKFGTLTNLEAPKIELDKYREMHIDYSESIGDARKSISVETYLTADELFKFLREVVGA